MMFHDLIELLLSTGIYYLNGVITSLLPKK